MKNLKCKIYVYDDKKDTLYRVTNLCLIKRFHDLHFIHSLILHDGHPGIYLLILRLLLPLRGGPARPSLEDENDDPQDGSGLEDEPDGTRIGVYRDGPVLGAQTAPVDQLGGAEELLDEPPLGRREGPAAVDGAEPLCEAGPQHAVEDAAADCGAERAAEAAEGAEEAGGDVAGAVVAVVEEVGEGVIDGGASDEAGAEDDGDDGRGGGVRVGAEGEGPHEKSKKGDGDEAGEPVGGVAADVEVADEDAAEGEADVCGEEDGAGAGAGLAVDGEHEDGGVEEDGPAGGEEAELGEAAEEGGAGGEDFEGDDGVGGYEVLYCEEDEESTEGQEEDEGLNVASEGVEEGYDGDSLE